MYCVADRPPCPAVLATQGASAMTDLVYDPFNPRIQDDPYAVYARLRDEAPVYHNPELDLWALTRFDDVWNAVHDPATFSSQDAIAVQDPRKADTEALAAGGIDVDALLKGSSEVAPMMIMLDPPRHDQLRDLVKRAFTPRRVAQLEPRVREIARELLSSFAREGACDLTAQFAGPLPTIVIAEMLGVPIEDRQQFRKWSNSLVTIDFNSSELTIEGMTAFAELWAYFSGIVEERTENPGDDLVSALIAAEIDGVRLQRNELLGFCVLLLLAGNETTTNLISNASVLLANHPDQRRLLVENPSLIPGAVEEFLRYDSPVQALGRITKKDAEVHGVTIPEGSRVALVFGAANHDDREFEDPERFDVTRKADRHLAFGHGLHYCLGASLARLEARVAFEELLALIPEWELKGPGVNRFSSGLIRGCQTLDIDFQLAASGASS